MKPRPRRAMTRKVRLTKLTHKQAVARCCSLQLNRFRTMIVRGEGMSYDVLFWRKPPHRRVVL